MFCMIPFTWSSRTKLIYGSKSQNSGYLKGRTFWSDRNVLFLNGDYAGVYICKISLSNVVQICTLYSVQIIPQKECSKISGRHVNWYNLSGALSGNICQNHWLRIPTARNLSKENNQANSLRYIYKDIYQLNVYNSKNWK